MGGGACGAHGWRGGEHPHFVQTIVSCLVAHWVCGINGVKCAKNGVLCRIMEDLLCVFPQVSQASRARSSQPGGRSRANALLAAVRARIFASIAKQLSCTHPLKYSRLPEAAKILGTGMEERVAPRVAASMTSNSETANRDLAHGAHIAEADGWCVGGVLDLAFFAAGASRR